jgi:hypothetical protein
MGMQIDASDLEMLQTQLKRLTELSVEVESFILGDHKIYLQWGSHNGGALTPVIVGITLKDRDKGGSGQTRMMANALSAVQASNSAIQRGRGR